MIRNKIIDHLKKQKIARRRALAMLSFPEKILILVHLQDLINSVNKIKGRQQINVWKI